MKAGQCTLYTECHPTRAADPKVGPFGQGRIDLYDNECSGVNPANRAWRSAGVATSALAVLFSLTAVLAFGSVFDIL